MDASKELFLSLLCAAIHGESTVGKIDPESWRRATQIANEHRVLPLLVETAWTSADGEKLSKPFYDLARKLTHAQAQRTADFLLLYSFLESRGLRPAVMKGIVLRALYPHPEQRASSDEDLLIRPEEFPAYHRALLAYGLSPLNPNADLDEEHEVSYADRERGLYIELHKSLFPPESEAYGELVSLFDGAPDRCVPVSVYGRELVTLSPTDHLLFLLCHAYKHFLHGGVGIRQVCDIGLFCAHYGLEIDWPRIRRSCDSVRVSRFVSALLRITQRRLGFEMPTAFSDLDVDEQDLLEDILSGGLYGVKDINRAHSSTITLDAVAKQKKGRRRSGALASVFLPLADMQGKFPYLKSYPWLLPVAWVQRVGKYLHREHGKSDPGESIRIGEERIRLLKEYGIVNE